MFAESGDQSSNDDPIFELGLRNSRLPPLQRHQGLLMVSTDAEPGPFEFADSVCDIPNEPSELANGISPVFRSLECKFLPSVCADWQLVSSIDLNEMGGLFQQSV